MKWPGMTLTKDIQTIAMNQMTNISVSDEPQIQKWPHNIITELKNSYHLVTL